MKKLTAIIAVLALLCSCALAEAGLTNFITYDVNIKDGETTDMKRVSQDIFKPYDLTMVNIWATWCGYCIQEMPELAKLKDMLPENVNLITICDDAAAEPELTYQILQMTGATNFPTLMATEAMYDSQLLSNVYAFPTTYFLNSEGMPVGQPITGVPSLEGAAEAYLSIINEVLASMEG